MRSTHLLRVHAATKQTDEYGNEVMRPGNEYVIVPGRLQPRDVTEDNTEGQELRVLHRFTSSAWPRAAGEWSRAVDHESGAEYTVTAVLRHNGSRATRHATVTLAEVG